MTENVIKVKRGQIYYAFLPETFGSVQKGWRPVVIVSNEYANEHSTTKTVVPLTTNPKTKYLPTHVHIKSNGRIKNSTALCEQITTISDLQLKCRIGNVPAEEMIKVDYGVLMQVYLKKRDDNSAKVQIGTSVLDINLADGNLQNLEQNSERKETNG